MIKQTQTKMFDFSDAGLNLCFGSKNKFPEVFKKILVTGFNPQTVTSVSIAGDQVTLTFGVNHGFVADRVLQVTASGGFNKEVYIDSVTSNSVTFTQAVNTGLSGTITTKVASLGWDIVYEINNIHIYKMKHINETDMYVRICFQNVTANRNALNVCVGKTIDLGLGTITDTNALQRTATITTPSPGDGTWEFGATGRFDATYSEGFPDYGKAMVVGSPYHVVFLGHTYYTGPNTSDGDRLINGIFPIIGLDYSVLDYPCILGFTGTSAFNTIIGASNLANKSRGWVGNYAVYFHQSANVNSYGFYRYKTNMSSFLPATIDGFNTTSTALLPASLSTTGQNVGFLLGITAVLYGESNYPTQRKIDIPKLSLDVSNTTYLIEHSIGWGSANNFEAFAIPLEEIKIGY